MTQRKHLKQLVRARMEKTGERYAAARRHVSGAAMPSGTPAAGPDFHFGGRVSGATALRVVLTAAGVRSPGSTAPFSEAMAFGIAGGIGIGVFSFVYEKEDFASLFVGARHLWHDDLAYFRRACARLGVTTTVKESAGAGVAAKQLRSLLADGMPCIAWVEQGLLPHRAPMAIMLGGGYHVITVYSIDEERGTALIGDRAAAPITIPLDVLAAARARIRKQKNRLFAIDPVGTLPGLDAAVRGGLRACHEGLLGAGAVARAKGNFTLAALATLADRMVDPSGKEAWVHAFAPGARLWNGLTMLYDFVEHAGTGGGLARGLFAEFLGEAAKAIRAPALAPIAARYAALGRAWTELARAALPDEIPVLRQARRILDRRAALLARGGDPAAIEEQRALRVELDDLAARFRARPAISGADFASLRAAMSARVRGLYDDEVAAHATLGRFLES